MSEPTFSCIATAAFGTEGLAATDPSNYAWTADALGIRMHSIRPGEGENAFRCAVEEVVENPFSITVMLRPLEAKAASCPIGWEMEKREWKTIEAKEITVHFPVDGLLQLKG